MYFNQENFFPSIDQSAQDLKKMMGLSMSNQQNILQSYDNNNYGGNQYQNKNENLFKGSYQESDDYELQQKNNQMMMDSSYGESQNQASRVMHQAYSKYEQEIKTLLPQIHSHLILKHYNQYEIRYQQRVNSYKQEISQKYQQQIQSKIDIIKQNINSNLTQKVNQINQLKQMITLTKKSNKVTQSLNKQQQSQLIEKTVQQIFNSQKLLNEIKEKLKPKIEQRVKFILLRDMQKQMNKCQNQIQDKIAQERQQFKQKRKVYWEQQAEKELGQLAVEYTQLKEKKASMEDIVREKLAEKQQVIKRHKEAIQRCKQVKQLQKQIKQMQGKINNSYKDNNNNNNNNKTKRSLSKGQAGRNNNRKTLR